MSLQTVLSRPASTLRVRVPRLRFGLSTLICTLVLVFVGLLALLGEVFRSVISGRDHRARVLEIAAVDQPEPLCRRIAPSYGARRPDIGEARAGVRAVLSGTSGPSTGR